MLCAGTGSYFLALLGYAMIGLFSPSLLVQWGAIGLCEMVLGGLLGARIYGNRGQGTRHD